MMNVTELVRTIKVFAPNMEVVVNKVQKGNVTLTGISIGNGSIKPTVYMEYFEDKYNTSGYIAVANEMIEMAKKAMKENTITESKVNQFTKWNYVKDHLRLCISPKGTNKDCVVYPYLDLEMYIRVIVDVTESGVASYKAKSEMLESWGITKEKLLHHAMLCTMPLFDTKSMGDTMYELTHDPMFLEDNDMKMIVANTKDGYNGASIIYCKDILKQIANKWKSDLVLIPSSIHEIMIKPVDCISLKEVSELIRYVNQNTVDAEEVLSDHAYVFHRDTMEITW